MAKKVTIRSGIEDVLRTGSGLAVVGLGTAVGGEIGALLGGFVAKNYLKSGNFVWNVAILSAVDTFLERIMKTKGVV